MTEWIEGKLSDIGEIVGGATPSTKDESNYDGEIAWLTPKDLSTFSERFISKGERSITEKGFKSCSTKMLPANTVLFSSRAPIGYVAIAANEMCTNQGFKSVIPNEKVDFMFLYYLLKYKKSAIDGMGSGTTFKEVSGNVMKNIEVRIPKDVSIQKRIAEVLDSIDSKIENNNQINRNLSEQARAVYYEKFGSCEKTKVLEDYPVKIYSGGTPSTSKKEYWEDGNIHWLSSGETANEFVITTEKTITQLGVDNSSTKWASKYDVVTASAGQGHTRGQTTMILLDTCINQSVIVTHAETDYMPFIFFNISGRYEELRALSDGTSTRGSLTTKIMAKLEMPDVSEKEIKLFSDYALPIISQIEINLKENERLTELRDNLLPKLMSGELDVSDLDI